jgi:hypothetical protein
MRPYLHLDPDGLRRAAVLAADVAEMLRASGGLDGAFGDTPDAADWFAEYDRVRVNIHRAAAELDMLRHVLLSTAKAAESADHDARVWMRRTGGDA